MKMTNVHSIGIEVKITDRCNLHCFHCMNGDSSSCGADMDVNLFLNKLKEWVSKSTGSGNCIGEVRITGGEPLLRPDEVSHIAEFCRSNSLSCGINTNGTLFTDDLAIRFKESGLQTIKISLDATDDAILKKMRGELASCEKTKTAIDTAVRHNFYVIIRFTLSKKNSDQLLPCYHLAQSLKVNKFQIKPLVASGRALFSDAFLSQEEIWACLSALHPSYPPEIEVLCWPHSLPPGMTEKICGNINKLYITTDLKLLHCNYLAPSSSIGDMQKDLFTDIVLNRFSSSDQVSHINGIHVFANCPQMIEACRNI